MIKESEKRFKKTIMLVEDEALIAEVEKIQLKDYGYNVITVNNGEQAIETVKNNSDIDLILMDINLGSGIDGTEASKIILKDNDIPILFLSCHTDNQTVEKTQKITSYGFVLKGSNITVIDTSIKMAFKLFQEKQKTKEKEDFIKTVLDNLPIGISVNSVEPQVNFEYMNENFCKYYKIKKEVLLKEDAFWEAIYEDPIFRKKIKQRVLNDCAGGDPEKMIWENIPVKRKNAETFYISAKNIPLPDKSLMISTVWDVTERYKYEEKIKNLNNEYDKVFNSTSSSLFLIKVIDNETYRYIRTNYSYQKATGISLEKMKNKTPVELLGEELGKNVIENYKRCYKLREPITFEETLDMPGGKYTW
jgi:CheY-like chemotaxis protein